MSKIPENECVGCRDRDRMILILATKIDQLEGRTPKNEEDDDARFTPATERAISRTAASVE